MVPFGVIQVVVIRAGRGSNCVTVTCEGARGTDSEGSCRLKLPTYEGSRRYRQKCKHKSKLKVKKQNPGRTVPVLRRSCACCIFSCKTVRYMQGLGF